MGGLKYYVEFVKDVLYLVYYLSCTTCVYSIYNSNIKEIKIENVRFKFSLFTDDTMAILDSLEFIYELLVVSGPVFNVIKIRSF